MRESSCIRSGKSSNTFPDRPNKHEYSRNPERMRSEKSRQRGSQLCKDDYRWTQDEENSEPRRWVKISTRCHYSGCTRNATDEYSRIHDQGNGCADSTNTSSCCPRCPGSCSGTRATSMKISFSTMSCLKCIISASSTTIKSLQSLNC